MNRAAITALINDGSAIVNQSMVDALKEWASTALPKGGKNKFGRISDGTISYHQSGTNRANISSTAKVKEIFERIKEIHQYNKKGLK